MTLYHAGFSSIERIGFSLEHNETLFQCVLKYKTKYKKFHIFGQNYGLTPLENLRVSDYIRCMFFFGV